MTTTRAERRRTYRDHKVSLLPKQEKGSCARPTCERNYRSSSHANRYRVCPACLATVETIEWLLTSGVLSAGAQQTPLEALGLIQPK